MRAPHRAVSIRVAGLHGPIRVRLTPREYARLERLAGGRRSAWARETIEAAAHGRPLEAGGAHLYAWARAALREALR